MPDKTPGLNIDLRRRATLTTSMRHKAIVRIIGVASALLGAVIGYWGVGLLARQGFHAIVLPAALPGVIAGVTSKERSVWWALLYGTIGVVAALFTEWRFRPFIVDSSLRYFLRHLSDLQAGRDDRDRDRCGSWHLSLPQFWPQSAAFVRPAKCLTTRQSQRPPLSRLLLAQQPRQR